MIELDKTKCYTLEHLNDDELKEVFNWLLTNDKGWECVIFEHWVANNKGFNLDCVNNSWAMRETDKPTTNAKELFYTLENIQVDCRELTEEQIKEMAMVFEKNGYFVNYGSLYCIEDACFLHNDIIDCSVYYQDEEKTTITYDKFMELFAPPAAQPIEPKPWQLSEKPTQYQIGIDTFQRAEANMTKEEIMACVRFNIDKYNWRKKGQDKQDFEKIIAYAQWGLKQFDDAN